MHKLQKQESSENPSQVDASLQTFFKLFSCDGEMSLSLLNKFVEDSCLVDRKLTSKQVSMIFDRVKSGHKNTINLAQFQEVCRLMACRKQITYQELELQATTQRTLRNSKQQK